MGAGEEEEAEASAPGKASSVARSARTILWTAGEIPGGTLRVRCCRSGVWNAVTGWRTMCLGRYSTWLAVARCCWVGEEAVAGGAGEVD